jgi:DNA polymerase IIIc chi subunit
MAKLELHQLKGSKRARQLADLLDQLHRERRRVVVWVADEGRRQILDDYLWTFEKLAFVPHILWGPELGEVEDPIVLVGEPANPNRASALVVGDDLPGEAWAGTFDEVHDFIPAGDEGEQRSQAWKDFGGDFDLSG